MRHRFRLVLILTLVTFITTSVPNIAFAQDIVTITAPNGVLIDYETGDVLFDKNAHEKTYPASTTKVMTAIFSVLISYTLISFIMILLFSSISALFFS